MEKQTYFLPHDAYVQVVYIQRINFLTIYFKHVEHLFGLFFSEMYHDSVPTFQKHVELICFFSVFCFVLLHVYYMPLQWLPPNTQGHAKITILELQKSNSFSEASLFTAKPSS